MDAARLAVSDRLIEGRGRMLEDVPSDSGVPRQAILSLYTKLVDQGLEMLDEETLRLSRQGLRAAILAVPHIRGREMMDIILDAGNFCPAGRDG